MTEHKSIAAALASAQAEMGRAIKDSNNPHFRSKYADLGNVMDACMPALTKHGIALIQPTGEDESGRYVETVLLHTSGESLRCRVPLIVSKNDMQGYGSAVTYARRYGLMAMAGIAPEDDDGNAAAKSPPKDETPKARKPSPSNTGPDPAQIAVQSLRNAETVEALASIWSSVGPQMQRVPMVLEAKNARKAELEAMASSDQTPVDDLDGDKVPF